MKRKYIHLMVLLLLLAVTFSCKKEKYSIVGTSSLTIVNCLSDATYLFPQLYNSANIDFSNKINGMPPVSLDATKMMRYYGLASGIVPLNIFAYPDSVKPVISKSLDLKSGAFYSFFLTGTKAEIDTLFIKDELPKTQPSDSLIVVRFINTCKTTNPLRINPVGKPAAPTMGNLSYNQISAYQTFSVKKLSHTGGENYNFEIHDAVTGDLLLTYAYPWSSTTTSGNTNYLSKGATIIITGSGNAIRCVGITPNLYN